MPQVRTARSRRFHQLSGFGLLSLLALVSARVPATVIVPVMVVVLAGIDIAGGIVAKSWALGRSPWAFVAGVALFVLLFWVYGLSLRHGELSTITIGWVVLVTLADMGLDRFHYDVHFPVSKWIAAFAAVGLLVYLLIGTNGSAPHAAEDPTGTVEPAPVAVRNAVPAAVFNVAPVAVPKVIPVAVSSASTASDSVASTRRP